MGQYADRRSVNRIVLNRRADVGDAQVDAPFV